MGGSLLVAALLLGAACSSGGVDGDDAVPAAGDDVEEDDVKRPDGPVATVDGPLTGGRGVSMASAIAGPELDPVRWVEEEYALSGTATSYRPVGELPADGAYELVEADQADYRTRILVRRPGSDADFNGTVLVEWLNVSAGFDANPDYSYLADEIVRRGYAWVGVSAQRIGIEGGAVAVSTPASEAAGAGRGLRASDPDRYGDLRHPGDAFSYDIYTQVARTLRAAGAAHPLGGLGVERILAVGESQSAFALTTYVNGVQPRARQYDGFLIHSRGGAAAPLGEPGQGIDMAGTLGGTPTRVRTDLDVPVMVLETETDVLGFLGYHAARQPDSDRFRLWEVAGAAHADAFLLGGAADLLGCPQPVNAGPLHLVAKAALRHLDAWARDGDPPPEAPRLAVDATPAFVRDDDGIVVGGIRTPLVDVPVDVLSGETAPGAPVICFLFGSTTPLPPERLAERYESPSAYLAAFEAEADAAIEAGFLLEDDRAALLAMADPGRIPG